MPIAIFYFYKALGESSKCILRAPYMPEYPPRNEEGYYYASLWTYV
jgi:hypothetical protein